MHKIWLLMLLVLLVACNTNGEALEKTTDVAITVTTTLLPQPSSAGGDSNFILVPYLDDWLRHESESLHMALKFQEDGTVIVNKYTKCCTTLLQGTYILENDRIYLQFENTEQTILEKEISIQMDGDSLLLFVRGEYRVFEIKPKELGS